VMWHAVILAASRGAEDPMAKAYGALHKCMIDVGGKPMLVRVVEALRASGVINGITISTETADVYRAAVSDVTHSPSQHSAPSSALAAIRQQGTFPVLITTGDHALLTPEMVRFVCQPRSDADIGVGLARAETIRSAYPETRRTYFKLGPDRVSGCNLFAVYNEAGLKLLDRWQELERHRKQPWKLVFAFGVSPLMRFLMGRLTLDSAFAEVSRQIGARAVPLILPFAEAAIDVDKPSDKELAEVILQRRG
jgi:hypothetical protein